ncbi:CHASE2 domain-containing protein [Myxacorys almedinensis]|uniref:Circadian input-output histidine kinase CikA n=1 Tax=Myxacorys almedinensis A TaxID=2690445 RepID=A0A8J7Z4L3_9CYAN|nr:CHASE2 domain-containing protein [Myxacorys almedinensis]NDJ18061.1 CHASE2 domain-containing protein [Myxacorys almedinensis A]
MWRRVGEKLVQWRGFGLSAIATSATTIALQMTGAFQLLELTTFDQWVRLRPTESIDHRVVLVTIDEQDIAQLGQSVVSDGTLARLLEKIKLHRPSVIGLDLYRDLPVEPGHQALLKVFATTPNLIGIEKVLSAPNDSAIAPPPILRDRDQVAASDLVPDIDGRIRRGLLSMRVPSSSKEPKTILTLGTRLALVYLELHQIKPRRIDAEGKRFQLGKTQLVALRAHEGGYVQADSGGYQILADVRRERLELSRISLTALLNDTIQPDLLAGRIVLVGATAASLGSRFYTSYTTNVQTRSSGVELHASLASQLVSAALDGKPILRGVAEPLEWGWIFVWSWVGTMLGGSLRSLRSAVVVIPLTGVGLIGSVYVLFLWGWWVTTASAIVALGGAGLASRGLLIWKQLQHSNQALGNYAKTLELKVQERTHELIQQNLILEKAKQEAESANRAKMAFLANMNHELRTPLSIIYSTSELIAYDKSLNPKHRERLSVIDGSVQHLLELINSVLELARLEAGAVSVEPEEVPIWTELEALQTMFRPQAVAKGLEFCCIYALDLPTIHTDKQKLRQVLMNLLSNAIKFTDQGRVTLRVFSRPKTYSDPSARLHFEVEDTGAGIAADELERLFQAFVQTESGRKSRQGTGLGLAICRQFVHLMGGEIEVQSKASVGTVFSFSLPLQPSELPL